MPRKIKRKTRSPFPSPAKIETSRANGRLSRGPATAEGRAASSRNALKFGFFADLNHGIALLPGESQAEYDAFRARLIETYQPADEEDELLVARVAAAGWRLRRFPAVEAALYSAEHLEEQADRAKNQARRLVHHRLEIDARDAIDPHQCRELLALESELRAELAAPRYALGRAFRRDVRGGGGLSHLSRCEQIVERSFYRALHQLQLKRQAALMQKRQNEPKEVGDNGGGGARGDVPGSTRGGGAGSARGGMPSM